MALDLHKFCFCSIFWDQIDRLSPNFIGWDCYTSFFAHLYQSCGPWFTPKFCLRSIPWEQIDRISPNFIYALILTRSSFGLLQIIFAHLYKSYGPWLAPKFRFRSISWEKIDRTQRISPNFYIWIHIDKIKPRIVIHQFWHIFTRVMALDLRQNQWFIYNFWAYGSWDALFPT